MSPIPTKLFPEAVSAKIERARKHSIDLTTSIAGWASSNPIQARCELREGRLGYRVIQLDYAVPPPLIDWGLMLGDYAHNVRSSLDNLAYALARLRKDPPDRPLGIAFPICDDEASFRKNRRRNLDQLPDEAAALIERMQPFQRDGSVTEGAANQDPLLYLQELNNADKHRVPSVILVAPANLNHQHQIEFESPADAQENAPPDVTAWSGPLSPGTVLYEMRTKHPIASVKGKTEIRASVAVVLLGKPFALDFLVSAIGAYTSMVVNQFATFFTARAAPNSRSS